MTDLVVTAAQVGVIYPHMAEIVDVILAETATAGQAAYLASTGKFGLGDANASGKQQFRGIFLKGGGAGQAVPLLVRGHVAGFTVSGLAYDALAYLSDTAGALADAAGTMSVIAGRVVPMPDFPNLTKVLFVNAQWTTVWS